MIQKMSFSAGMGHPCGVEFKAGQFLKEHKQFDWQRPELQDLKANSWTIFEATPAKPQ